MAPSKKALKTTISTPFPIPTKTTTPTSSSPWRWATRKATSSTSTEHDKFRPPPACSSRASAPPLGPPSPSPPPKPSRQPLRAPPPSQPRPASPPSTSHSSASLANFPPPASNLRPLSAAMGQFHTLPSPAKEQHHGPTRPPKRPPSLPAVQLLRADTLVTTTTVCCLPTMGGGEEREGAQQQQQRLLLLWQPSPQNCAIAAGSEPTAGPFSGHIVQEPAAQRQEHPEEAVSPSKQLFNSLKYAAKMVCCFCCCPVHRCVLWFCALELICSIYMWYSELSELVRTYATIQLKDILILVILSGWLITLGVSTVSLILAKRNGDPQWVLPRLVQQTGLLILGFLMVLLFAIYFAGGAQAINNLLISIYEHLYSDPISRESRQGVHEDLRFYFTMLILADLLFIGYISSALCATMKFYRELQITGGGRPFQRVNQHDPTRGAPRQPPVNPYYKGSIA